MTNERLPIEVDLRVLTSPSPAPAPSADLRQFLIGIALAILSSLFIGSSFILKKKGLIKQTTNHGRCRAALGGYGYLCEFQWWAGLGTMAAGELCNFTAYGFAPASVVTPLGALSVLVSTLLAVRFLNEKLTFLGKVGCVLTLSGSVIIVIHAPKDSEVHSLNDFARRLTAPDFLLFLFVTLLLIVALIVYSGPRLGSRRVHVYMLICSLLGAFTVTACKGLAVGLKEIYEEHWSYSPWLTCLCAMVIVVSVIIQIIYLNRALDLFSTAVVTTVYYVLFTTCVLITSGILFREWRQLTLVDIFACLVGFLVVTCGLILINDLRSELSAIDLADDRYSSCFSSSESISPVNVKRQVKSYANLLLDDEDDEIVDHLSLPMTAVEERQTRLLMVERDPHC